MALIRRPQKPRPPRQPPAGPRPALPMIQLPIFRVKSRDLEDYLFQVYRISGFDFLLATGMKAGECPEYAVQATLPQGPDSGAAGGRDSFRPANKECAPDPQRPLLRRLHPGRKVSRQHAKSPSRSTFTRRL